MHDWLPRLTILCLLPLGGCGGGDEQPTPADTVDDVAETLTTSDITSDVLSPQDATPDGGVNAAEVSPQGTDIAAVDTLDTDEADTEITESPDADPETTEPFVCGDDAACIGRVEVLTCTRAACVAGHCVVLPDEEGLSCDDGDPCTIGNVCQSGSCSAGVPLDCSGPPGQPCILGACDSAQGGCITMDVDDGALCDDDDLCTTDDGCVAGVCAGQPTCDDGDVCNGLEGCNDDGVCTPGTPLGCQSADPCLGVPSCDPIFGCVLGPPPDCGSYLCAEGSCPSSCEGHDQCVPGTFCAEGDCVPTLDDGASCVEGAMCTSGHCGGTVCCAGGQCCTTDTECPLSGVAVVASQESTAEQSGFARVVIGPSTFGGQTFTPTATSVLERVDLMLQTPAQEGYLLEVVVSTAPPPGEPLATTSLLVVAQTADPTIWTATFKTPATLEAGQTYLVSASWLNGDADCVAPCAVIWMGEEANPYPDGTVYRTYDQGAAWQPTPYDDDLWFRVWAGQHSCQGFSCLTSEGQP